MKTHAQKCILTCLLTVALATVLQAAIPQTIQYRGRLTDAAGDPVADGSHLVKFIIYDASSSGNVVWNSGFQTLATSGGLFNYALGSNVAFPDDLFTDTSRYLGITVGVDPEISPRTRLKSSAYSYHSLRSDTADISVTVFDGAILPAKLAPNSVSQIAIQPNSVGASEIQDNAIGSAEVIDNSLTANDLGPNSVGASEIADNTIGSAQVLDNSLTAADLAPGSVGSSEVASNSLTGADLAKSSVSTSEVLDNSLTAADLAPNSVTSSEIAGGAVGTSEVLDGSLTANDLGANSVGPSELQGASVVGGTGGTILDNSITNADIAASTITGTNIANGSVFDNDLGDEPGVAQNARTSSINITGAVQLLLSRTLTALTSGFVLVIASFEASVSHVNGTVSSVDFGVSNSMTTFPFAGAKQWRISNLQPTGTREEIISISRIFSVLEGPKTFYLLGDKISGVNDHNVDEVTLSLVFIPSLYGSFAAEPPFPPEGASEEEALND